MLKEGVEKMDLFKERLKIVCGYILAWVHELIMPAVIIIYMWFSLRFIV